MLRVSEVLRGKRNSKTWKKVSGALRWRLWRQQKKEAAEAGEDPILRAIEVSRYPRKGAQRRHSTRMEEVAS